MIKNKDIDIDSIRFHDSNSRHREIAYVYYQGRKLWELIIGFLFSKDGYSLHSKDNYVLKGKDQ